MQPRPTPWWHGPGQWPPGPQARCRQGLSSTAQFPHVLLPRGLVVTLSIFSLTPEVLGSLAEEARKTAGV